MVGTLSASKTHVCFLERISSKSMDDHTPRGWNVSSNAMWPTPKIWQEVAVLDRIEGSKSD